MFLQTRWTIVRHAQGDDPDAAFDALAALCQTCWAPLYAFVRRSGKSPHDAEDLTQAFFARLLEKDHLATVGEEKGKLRSFLLVLMKRFMANDWERGQAQKRGGGVIHVSMDQEFGEAQFKLEPADDDTPERAFDRLWAMTLLDNVRRAMQSEYEKSGRLRTFEALKNSLSWRSGDTSYSEIAKELECSEGAVKAAVHRMRKRYRKLLEKAIADTVSDEEAVQEEL
ncbi:MAG: RNA polymerase sigma factor (sigma-70 family) [Verrucomicrobiales bacterium]|jgi:RNA polymerase sigma factor (sigma-70 family)